MNPIIVRMNEVGISTDTQPIIGTQALGPCVGVLIHSKNQKKSVVLHASSDWKQLIVETLIVLVESKLISIENFNKALENLYLHDQFNLYDFDSKIKKAILTKKGLNITKVEETLEVTIIPGYYQDNYEVAINLAKYFMSLSPLVKVKSDQLPKKAVRTVMFDDLGSHEFFYDSQNSKFVTEKVKDIVDSKGYRL